MAAFLGHFQSGSIPDLSPPIGRLLSKVHPPTFLGLTYYLRTMFLSIPHLSEIVLWKTIDSINDYFFIAAALIFDAV